MESTPQTRFQQEIDRLLELRIGTALVVGAFVFPCFVTEDQWLVPQGWRHILALRLTCSLTCLLFAALNKTFIARRHTFGFVAVAMATVSVVKTFTTGMNVSGIQSLYYGGHTLILAGCLAFLPLTLSQSLVLTTVCILSYGATNLLFASVVDPVAFQIQIGLLAAIGLLLSMGRHLDYAARWREFQLRNKLYQVRRRADDYGWDASGVR